MKNSVDSFWQDERGEKDLYMHKEVGKLSTRAGGIDELLKASIKLSFGTRYPKKSIIRFWVFGVQQRVFFTQNS